LEKNAKKFVTEANSAAKRVNDAAKMVYEDENIQAVAGKIQEQTKNVTIKVKEHMKSDNKTSSPKKQDETTTTTTTESIRHFENNPKSPETRNKSFRPFKSVKADAHGEGDMSDIVWEDGSVKRIDSLRVFGKDTIIVVADEFKLDKKEKEETKEADAQVDAEDDGTERTLPLAIEEQKGPPKVTLPVLIFPGMCSSGLFVENSGLDNKKFQGRRLWMNAGFFAESAMDKKIVSSSRTINARNNSAYVDDTTPRSSFVGNVEDLNRDSNVTSTPIEENKPLSSNDVDTEYNTDFAQMEEELNIRSAWLYHIALDKNMVDEREGNRVRPYEGLKAVEWLADDAIGKSQAVVWAELTRFLEKEMGYIRGKNLDAVPYDWRLPPLTTETRDRYLTSTIERVERMYQENGGLPIVMCCHSMGCRMGHYFLNFCLREKGREWIDQHIHTYMPVGAPHTGAPFTARLGIIGSGLVPFVDDVFKVSPEDGITMYRSWGSGCWLIPSDLPNLAFPTCIVRREGELGIKVTSEIDVGPLFSDREKPPRELRLTLVFRDKIRASTNFVPLKIGSENSPGSMIIAFDETFYLAVPNLEEGDDDIGDLVFFLEEPAAELYTNDAIKLRTQFQNYTRWARGFKKGVTRFYRNVAKKIGSVLQVAVCEKPLEIKLSSFTDISSITVQGSPIMDTVVPICKCNGVADAKKTLNANNDDNYDSESDDDEEEDLVPYVSDDGKRKRRLTCYNFDNPFTEKAIGNLSISLRYNPPPEFPTQAPNRTAKLSMIPEDSPTPHIVNKKIKKSNIDYEAWHCRDLLDQDGFCGSIFDVHGEYYEQDPLGPLTKSALDAPPVNIVRSIYGINVPSEVGAIYRKEPVVTIGDNKADFRYRLDKSASFGKLDSSSGKDSSDEQQEVIDPWVEEFAKGHRIINGVVKEMPEALQQVPGMTEKRRCCGDGTVPYWSLVHCLNWKDSIPTLTVDEIEGGEHRSILSNKKFHALLQQHITVDDPRDPEDFAIVTSNNANEAAALAAVEQMVSDIGL